MKFEPNTAGRDFITGDIHGCFSDLEDTLLRVGFDRSKDRLFCVGDLVDRGPESHRALEWLAYPWFHSVRGNHEDMAINAACSNYSEHMHISNGGEWFYELTPEQQQEFATAFRAMPYAIQVGDVGIIHADIPEEMTDWTTIYNAAERLMQPLSLKQYEELHRAQMCMLWSRQTLKKYLTAGDTRTITGIERVYVGHTIIDKPPIQVGNMFFIDSGAYLRHWNKPGGFIFLAAL